jgi:hypothetical protein
MNDLEAAGQALGQSPLEKERRRSEQDDLQWTSGSCVGIPEALHHFGPARHLLNFVQHKERSPLIAIAEQEAGAFPLCLKPVRPTKSRLISAGKYVRELRLGYDLAHESRLTDLARSGDDLNESALFGEPPEQLGSLRSPVIRVAHHSE